ncbi:Uncharacterized protein FWK35_00006632 [Aphis craccivora]|uniref:Uncharacterized protein n=1 Tax=Aphis craccivora TaxID=307492 RepID=A0A6G0ZQD5_APHCR|nr:Uncharacterized protein FWK35_00006632 [Aphis craccivora]
MNHLVKSHIYNIKTFELIEMLKNYLFSTNSICRTAHRVCNLVSSMYNITSVMKVFSILFIPYNKWKMFIFLSATTKLCLWAKAHHKLVRFGLSNLIRWHLKKLSNSERSDECIDFTMMCFFFLIFVSVTTFWSIFKSVKKNPKKVTEKREFLHKTSFPPNRFFYMVVNQKLITFKFLRNLSDFEYKSYTTVEHLIQDKLYLNMTYVKKLRKYNEHFCFYFFENHFAYRMLVNYFKIYLMYISFNKFIFLIKFEKTLFKNILQHINLNENENLIILKRTNVCVL